VLVSAIIHVAGILGVVLRPKVAFSISTGAMNDPPEPLAIYEADGTTRFTIEQPSTTLSALGRAEITQVGIDLDRKLGRLLAALNVEVPAMLSESRAAG
jgi:hypothetical protein